MTIKAQNIYKALCLVGMYLAGLGASVAQPYGEDLWGFRLGQLREVVQKQLGEPFKAGIYTDKYEYETYLLYVDSSLQVTFEYAPDSQRGAYKISAIKLEGWHDKVVFRGLKLGDDAEVVEKLAGKPSYKKATYNQGERWEYWESNYLLELYKGKLYSIKIKDITLDLYAKYDRSLIPKFSQIVAAFTEDNRAAMMRWLHPEFEAYPDSLRFYFGFAMQQEIDNDTSKVFLLCKDKEYGLPAFTKAQKGDIVEKLLFEKRNPPIVYYRCSDKFKIKEIELVFFLGEYKIRRISYRQQPK